MAQLETLILSELSQHFVNILKVASTVDLKLLSVLDNNGSLAILSVKTPSNVLYLSNIKSFAWQEDNYYLNEYRLLAIDKHNETCYYVINVKSLDDQNNFLEVKSLTKWHLKEAFQHFHETFAKQLEDVPTYEILQFEAKEAVFLFDKKIVASFFLSPFSDPQIMSISNLSDTGISFKKVVLVKEMLFALDISGTKLYIYSFINNTKLYETKISDCSVKHSDAIVVYSFSVNLNLDLVVFITENKKIFTMSLNFNEVNNSNKANFLQSRIVTAFTKQYPSVREVGSSLKRYSVSSGHVQQIFFTCYTSDLILEDVTILENKLFFLYCNDEESLLGIHKLEADEPTVYKRQKNKVFFIHCDPVDVTVPLLLFFENKISLLKYDIDQNKLVNELMMYPSSSTVETLASLNDWSSIQMDIEVLKSGLSNRKVYTVELYLKTLFDGFSQSWNAPTSSKWFEKIQKECEVLESILNLVLQNVKLNLSESVSYQYAEQLLLIVINMLIQIVELIGEKSSDGSVYPSSEKNILLDKFTQILLEMRKLLREQEKTSLGTFSSFTSHVSSNSVFEASDYCKKWQNITPEDIIQESILTGNIPLAQSYFYCCGSEGNASFQQFEQASENLVVYFLRQGLITEALTVLLNMGIEINSELLKIFKTTSEKDIRALVLNELQERNLLCESDLKLLKFVSLIEKLYPCTSFEHARGLLDEKSVVSVSEASCAVPHTGDVLLVGDTMISSQDNSESGAYCRIALDWVSSWDNDVKCRILAPHFLKNSPTLDFFMKEGTVIEINPVSLWSYLLENGCLPYLTNWIETFLNPEMKISSSVFKDRQITGDMINLIPERATLYISETLLNKLARIGIFCSKELEDISLFLSRINQSQCDVNDISIFSSSKASLTFSDLMHKFVHYCLQYDLNHLLYFFILKNYNKFSVWPSCKLCDVPILNLTVAFYLWAENPKDSEQAYKATAQLAQHIFNLKNNSTGELLLNLPLPLSLSILLFKSQPLTDTVHNAFKNPEVLEHLVVKEKFLCYPLLYNNLFKSTSERSHPDFTVYELLKDNTLFDTSQLFGWQSSNSNRCEDSLTDLPHFSLKTLSEQYGLKKQLNYLYYLLQRRPNYAYLKYIQEEISTGSGLSIARIKSACSDVADFALENYRNSEISLSCIIFTELAGQDSLPLRACLVAANILHENMTLSTNQEYEKSFPEIWKMFKQAVVSKEAAHNLVTNLESIAMKTWDPYCTDHNSLVKDICLWMPVMTLSHLYQIETGSPYLYECAKQNKWLKFLVFAQIFQLPKEQVLKAASKFSNSCIYYHIFHALHKKSVMQNVSSETKDALAAKAPKRDMRKSLYTRIGVLKKVPVDTKHSFERDDDQCSISSEETVASSSSSEAEIGSIILKDIFSQLLLAHGSDVPWEFLLHSSFEIQNPVLAVLAASYPDSPLQSCFYTWLYTSLCQDEDCKKHVYSHFQDRISAISTDDIENLILFAVQSKKFLLIWQAVQFFIPNTPLMPLMEFLRDFFVFKKFDSSVENFQNQLWDYPKKSELPSVIYSVLWIENMSVSILKESVIACSTNYERLILLHHFSHTRLEKSFSKEVTVPPFMKVCHMLQYTGNVEQDIDVEMLFLPEHDVNYKNTSWMIVKKLLQLHLFHEAEMFANAARLPLEDLFLLQMSQTLSEARENSNWSKLSYRISFWKPILDKLSSTLTPVHLAVEFLENHCEISDMYGEKYFLMRYIVNLLSIPSNRSEVPETKSYDVEDLQRKMWRWCVKAEVKKEILPEIFDFASANDFDLEVVSNSPQKHPYALENNEEKEALSCIINHLLSKKDLKKAFELSSVFDYQSQDLEIIKICLQLAKDEIQIASVNLSLPDCNTEIASSRFIRSLLLWLSSSSSAFVPSSAKETMMCIESLGRKSEAAVSICHQIFVDFIVSTILKKKYVDVVKEKDVLSILKEILTRKLNDELTLAKCFIIVHDIPDREVSVFLSEEIRHSLQVLSILDLVLVPEEQLAFSEELIYDPFRAKESFQVIVKLCQDPSILGKILMDILSKETSDLSAKSPDKTFSIAVELSICAHECLTAACNMEGISQILHHSQFLVNILEEAKKFPIMVRLLMGLGRYSEMSYVFDILKTHEKLSLLFAKKLENAPSLKLALLDYLKRLPPSESENYFYTLAKTFGMYREKAEILEMSVQKLLSQLCKKNLDINMKEELENAVQCLAEASKSYCKADCLHQAQNCTRLAQLVALQIYFLPSGIWIVGLDDSSVSRFITEHDNFSQSYIVAEYYGNHQLWSQAILNNMVIRGDKEYLHNFRAHFGLSTSLISDVVKRYQKLNQKPENSMKNMRFLLNLCPDIKEKYCFTQELGLTDLASELLMGEGAPYLQDLIASNII